MIELPLKTPQEFEQMCNMFEILGYFKRGERTSYNRFRFAKYEDTRKGHPMVTVYFNNWDKNKV
jgi:hypothetical protein